MHNDETRKACTHSLVVCEMRLTITPGTRCSKLPSCGAYAASNCARFVTSGVSCFTRLARLADPVFPSVFKISRIPPPSLRRVSFQRNQHGDLELRIVFFHVAGSVLLAEFLGDGGDFRRVRNRDGLEFGLRAACFYFYPGIFDHVLIPLRLGSGDRQQIKIIPVKDEPHWTGTLASGFSSGDRDLNFAMVGERLFQRIDLDWHRNSFTERLQPLSL